MCDNRPTVLIADPHEQYRSGLVRAITMHPGLRVDSVTDDGFVALSLILTRKPDLALLDVRLAGLDGFRIAERLGSGQGNSETRIVLLTAVLDHAQRARALSVGAVECLAKDASRTEI
jgi:DNA-binding NarL/FixJ family response regulator